MGTVWIDPLGSPPESARVAMALVRFEPGSRTAWRTHPLGQTPIATASYCRVQSEGGPIQEIRLGSEVWYSQSENHWHGRSPTTAIGHIVDQGQRTPATRLAVTYIGRL